MGLNAHAEFAGSAPHLKVNVPDEPLAGVSTKVKFAVCPLATVWLDEPLSAAAKSSPIPDSGACALAASAELATVRLPVCCPALAGVNVTPTVQLAPGASVLAHVLFAI